MKDEMDTLKQIAELSNGRFDKTIVVSGDNAIILMNLAKIYILAKNRIDTIKKEKSNE